MAETEHVGLNSKHLAKGSTEPSKPASGRVRLYSMRFCPYAERAMIALQLKKIPFEVININLQDKPEWYLVTNPLGKVPAVEHNGKIVYESLVVADYVDDVFKSGQKILPEDPYERAKQRMLVERLSTLHSALYQWYSKREDEKAIAKVDDALKLYEKLLEKQFFAGDKPGYVDYMNWPWVERLAAVEHFSDGKIAVTKDKYPKFAAYIERLNAVPEIKEFAVDGATHVKFIKSRFDGKPNYDILL